MKIVINVCYGGFSISPLAIATIAKKKGKECYFFKHEFDSNKYTPISLEEATDAFIVFAYSVSNPEDYDLDKLGEDNTYKEANERSKLICLDSRADDRTDKDLIETIEELGEKADGSHAKLKVIEIPDNIEYIIEEYDGIEHIAEKHRTWS